MRNRLNDILEPLATTGWLRAGILVLLLAAYAAPAALTTGAEPAQTTSEHTSIATVHITEGDTREAVTATYGGDIVVSHRRFDDRKPWMPKRSSVHDWAG